jgi:hypothetical protein
VKRSQQRRVEDAPADCVYNALMLDAPRQNWSAYEARVRAADEQWLRSLTVDQKFALYCDFFDALHNSRDPAVNREQLERWRWQQKLAARRRQVEAFRRLDEWRERRAQNNAH